MVEGEISDRDPPPFIYYCHVGYLGVNTPRRLLLWPRQNAVNLILARKSHDIVPYAGMHTVRNPRLHTNQPKNVEYTPYTRVVQFINQKQSSSSLTF